jgi:hypothetical protein
MPGCINFLLAVVFFVTGALAQGNRPTNAVPTWKGQAPPLSALRGVWKVIEQSSKSEQKTLGHSSLER